MNRMKYLFGIACVLLCMEAVPALAQTFYMNPLPESKPKFSLRFLHPIFKEYYGPDAKNLSGEYQLAMNIPFSEKFNLVVSMALFRESFEIRFTDETGVPLREETVTEHAWGNAYIGLQSRTPLSDNIKSSFAAGFYLPTATEDYKYYATIYSRVRTSALELRSYLAKTVVFYTNYAIRMESPGRVGGIFGLEAGPELFLPTSGGDPELLAHYGVSAGIKLPYVAAVGELSGLFLITTDVGNFAEQFDNFFAFGAQATDWPVRPGIFYQIPLDDEYRYALKGVLGVKVDAFLP